MIEALASFFSCAMSSRIIAPSFAPIAASGRAALKTRGPAGSTSAPLSPTRPRTSPRRRCRLTSRSTFVGPYDLVMCLPGAHRQHWSVARRAPSLQPLVQSWLDLPRRSRFAGRAMNHGVDVLPSGSPAVLSSSSFGKDPNNQSPGAGIVPMALVRLPVAVGPLIGSAAENDRGRGTSSSVPYPGGSAGHPPRTSWVIAR